MNRLNDIIKVADIHVNRINSALKHTQHFFPINSETVLHIQEEDLGWVDLLISRFGKLQDLLGSKLIDIFFEMQQEDVEHLTMIDKLNKLERFGIIESQELWKEMREARNHVAHEYPDNPALAARYLNIIYDLTPKLLQILDEIKKRFY